MMLKTTHPYLLGRDKRKCVGAIFALLLLTFSGIWNDAQAQPANNNCANAIALTVDAACTAGTTQNGTIEGTEDMSCFTGGGGCNLDQTTWYSFNTGTNTSMWLDFDVTNSPNCQGGYAVYGPFAGASCLPGAGSRVACENTPPALGGSMVTGLTAGSTYMVQVLGRNGGGGGDRYTEYCIAVESPLSCSTCSSPCGGACGFTTVPTVTQVTSSCPEYTLAPHLGAGESGTWCYTLTATNDTLDFGLIISQVGCAGGNISAMSWELRTQGACGMVSSGAFPTLQATGLTIGTDYTFCYSLTVAAACTHTSHYPFWVGANALPVEYVAFDGKANKDNIQLSWVIETAHKEKFIIERSSDGQKYEPVGDVMPIDGSGKRIGTDENMEFAYVFQSGASGKTVGMREFSFVDESPMAGDNYYRIRTIDENGDWSTSEALKIGFEVESLVSQVYPSPATGLAHINIGLENADNISVRAMDLSGRVVSQNNLSLSSGKHAVKLDISDFNSGIYFIEIILDGRAFIRKMIVN